MTTHTAFRTPTLATGKPLSRAERRRRRRAKARAKARARALAKKRAARERAAAAARQRAAEAARARASAPVRTPAKSSPASTPQYPILSSADRHVVDRFSYGWNQDLARDVAAAGGGARWFEQQLAPEAISDPATARMVSENWFPVLNKDYAGQWKDHVDEVRFTWEAGFDLSRLSLARKIASRRQVHEMMSEFWLNHLYIPAGEDRSSVHRSSYEELVRGHALGSFRAMLKGAIQHPAMVGFLTNYANTKKALNENLGRELLELHTVGVGAGYGEDGVKVSSRILTGFTLDTFKTWKPGYDTTRHWTGQVDVMGFSHANTAADGRPVLEAYLDHLARHDKTAERLARKLCVRFVSDDPSASIVAAVKKAYLDNDTAIKPMLRALVAHPDFANSRGVKLRTPVEDLVATARALGATLSKPITVKRGDNDPNFTTHIGWMSENLGYRPYTWPRPDGPPDKATAWDSATRMLRTWENRYSMAGGWWQSKAVTFAAPSAYLPTSWPQRLDTVINTIGVRLTGTTPTAAELAAAIAVLVDRTPDQAVLGFRDEWKYLSAWDLLRIRGTLLNSPAQLLR